VEGEARTWAVPHRRKVKYPKTTRLTGKTREFTRTIWSEHMGSLRRSLEKRALTFDRGKKRVSSILNSLQIFGRYRRRYRLKDPTRERGKDGFHQRNARGKGKPEEKPRVLHFARGTGTHRKERRLSGEGRRDLLSNQIVQRAVGWCTGIPLEEQRLDFGSSVYKSTKWGKEKRGKGREVKRRSEIVSTRLNECSNPAKKCDARNSGRRPQSATGG